MFSDPAFVMHAVGRLLLAAALGAAIGLERERRHKPAGLRTILLISFGSALFTLLSEALAALHGGDPQRIAAQLIPGIGFLGAGAILQSRGSVHGLTTAAIIFVMASVGMAAGGGMHLLAIACTALLLVFLVPIGMLEKRFETQPQSLVCSFETRDPETFLSGVRNAARRSGVGIANVRLTHTDHASRVEFSVDGPEEAISPALGEIERVRRSNA